MSLYTQNGVPSSSPQHQSCHRAALLGIIAMENVLSVNTFSVPEHKS